MRQGLGDQAQVVAGEGDVGGFDGRVRAGGAHGDADLGGGQGGGVVDAVTDHRGGGGAGQLADGGGLVLGAQFGAHVADAGVGGDGPGGAGVVAGEHRDPDALAGQGGHDGGDLGAQLVPDPDRSGRRPVAVDDNHGHALPFQGLDIFGDGPRVQPAGAADSDRGPVEAAGDAVPGGLGDGLGRRRIRGGGGDGRGQRVGAVLLQRRRPAQHILLRGVCGGEHGGDSGLIAGQGAGLVHGEVADPAEAFEGRPGLDDDPEPAGRADRRDRRKEPKQVAPNDNNGGSEDSKCVNRPPAPNPNTSGPQYSEYSWREPCFDDTGIPDRAGRAIAGLGNVSPGGRRKNR
ncbi:hypothetical protein CITRIK5_80062 [Citricoccus sp. K5]|nr:hypothetical protein CITRIK5_80062 [Citricoccus sp. K5]